MEKKCIQIGQNKKRRISSQDTDAPCSRQLSGHRCPLFQTVIRTRCPLFQPALRTQMLLVPANVNWEISQEPINQI